MNAFISYLYQIEISDDALICKSNNRKITYTELRLLMFLRNKKFTSTKFKALFENILLEEYQVSIDYSIIQVISFFKTFVSEPDYIDNLILVHKYTCDIWKNGSKHLYFYTLHNQEHAVDLIQNSIKVIRAIDYIDISRNDYYVLFIACYLHDISMVTLPNLDEIQKDKFDCNKIYSDFVETVRKEEKTSKLAINPVKKLLKDYYVKMDVFYEKIVRENHAKNSAREIRNRNDLKFVDAAIREIVAEVSEAHGYNVSEIYKIKSNASSKIWSQKYTKIILRLADLLDMSNYRVSQLVLNHNLDNMGETSRFHWLSHLVTRGYNINTEYIFTKEDKKSLLDRGSIKEKIVLTVFVDLPQFTKGVNGGCKNMKLDGVSENKISLVCDEECKSDQCNFLCKWFAKKNEYLFVELASLREYLNSVPDRYFESEIEVIVDSRNKNFLSEKQFTMLKEYVEG